MKSKNTKVTSTIVLALLVAGIMSQTIGFGGIGHQSSHPQIISQAPTPLNLNVTLNADGASFPFPLITQYILHYHASNPNVTINYTPTGSGQGQKDFINKTMDFAASDAPLNSGQRILAADALHIPETIGSVVPAYNVPGLATGLNLNGTTLANIYLGTITNWNDVAIQQQNPGTTLPAQPIKVVWRFDSSGTTFIWTSFLSQDSTTWRTTPGLGPSTGGANYPWPVGVGASLNSGVATYIVNTQYALGYVELNYALQNSMTFAAVKNPAGNYILASPQTTTWAVNNSTKALPRGDGDWSSVNMLNAAGANSYPIASFTYFLVHKELNEVPSMDLTDGVQAKALIAFLNWVITTGQQYAPGLSYVQLPPTVVSLDQATINSIAYTNVGKTSHKTFYLSANSVSGWNQTTAGPSLTVVSNDTVTLMLRSSDGATHQWFIDFNNNGLLDANETSSPAFSSTTTFLNFTFKPVIWSQASIPHSGTFTYRDNASPTAGSITINPQQTAAVFLPRSSLTLGISIDSNKVSTIGTAIINMRTLTISGNITVAAVDKTSGGVNLVKSYLLPNLRLQPDPSGTILQARVELNIDVLPYALSSDILIQLQGTKTTATGYPLRQPDIAGDGTVDIIDVSFVFIRYGSVLGGTNYDPRADLVGNGRIDLIDASIIALRFGTLVLR